jgi:hypothetical protein
MVGTPDREYRPPRSGTHQARALPHGYRRGRNVGPVDRGRRSLGQTVQERVAPGVVLGTAGAVRLWSKAAGVGIHPRATQGALPGVSCRPPRGSAAGSSGTPSPTVAQNSSSSCRQRSTTEGGSGGAGGGQVGMKVATQMALAGLLPADLLSEGGPPIEVGELMEERADGRDARAVGPTGAGFAA